MECNRIAQCYTDFDRAIDRLPDSRAAKVMFRTMKADCERLNDLTDPNFQCDFPNAKIGECIVAELDKSFQTYPAITGVMYQHLPDDCMVFSAEEREFADLMQALQDQE